MGKIVKLSDKAKGMKKYKIKIKEKYGKRKESLEQKKEKRVINISQVVKLKDRRAYMGEIDKYMWSAKVLNVKKKDFNYKKPLDSFFENNTNIKELTIYETTDSSIKGNPFLPTIGYTLRTHVGFKDGEVLCVNPDVVKNLVLTELIVYLEKLI